MESDPVVFNPFDPVWRADPYPLYRQLRTEAPVGQVPGIGIWYLTRYADCERMLRDPRTSSEGRNSELLRRLSEAGVLRLPENVPAQRSFLFMDPPDHTRLRGLVASAFTLKVVNNLKPRIRQLVDELLDAAVARGRLEIVEDLAYPLPFIVISELVGIPAEDQPRFRAWSKAMTGSLDPSMVPSSELIERQATALRETTQYLGALIDERRLHPSEDLLSALIQVEQEGDRLSKDELLGTVILLEAAGHETTANLIANGVLALLQHPEQLARLRADPSLSRAVAEETLRWDPPIQMTRRIPLEDMEFGGLTIEKGTPVMLVLAAANRDEAVTPDGERFDIGRSEFRHLTFGLGPHFCLGAPLGRIEGAIALSAIATRFPRIRLAEEGLRRRSDFVMRGLEALPVEI